MELNAAQIVVTALLSSGMVGGVFALLTKMVSSPEAKNDLARLGNEFAHQLLQDAKLEREELRLTIRELEELDTKNRHTIERLHQLAEDKEIVIQQLEARMGTLAKKLEEGVPISLKDIFGDKAPDKLYITRPEIV